MCIFPYTIDTRAQLKTLLLGKFKIGTSSKGKCNGKQNHHRSGPQTNACSKTPSWDYAKHTWTRTKDQSRAWSRNALKKESWQEIQKGRLICSLESKTRPFVTKLIGVKLNFRGEHEGI